MGDPISHRMMVLVLQLGVILLAAKIGHVIALRMRLPGVLGEMGAGLVLGPAMLGGIALPGLHLGLFPHLAGAFPLSSELYGICVLGSIVLLFVAGLETDLELFFRFSLASTAVGVAGVVVSFVVGDLVTVWLAPRVAGVSLGFLDPPCLFMGVLSTATSVGVSARVLSDRRQMASPEGVTIVGGAVVDDVLGIVLLGAVLSIVGAEAGAGSIAWAEVMITAAKACGVGAAGSLIVLLGARHLGALLKLFRGRTSIATMAFGLALILAGLFEEAGLAMIIGAYVVGLALSRTDIRYVVQDRLRPVYALLVPVLFCSMGLMVDVRSFMDPGIPLFTMVFAVTAIAAKILGCGGVALAFGFNPLGALRVGAGMTPRGEVAAIIAAIGLGEGVLSQALFSVGMAMNVATVFAAPMLLSALLASGRAGTHRDVPPSKGTTSLSFDFSAPEVTHLVVDEIVTVLETEGFFGHTSVRGEKRDLHFRKNEVMIDLRQTDHRVIFRCDERDVPIVNEVVGEAIATLDRAFLGFTDAMRSQLGSTEADAPRPAPSSGDGSRWLQVRALIHEQSIEPDLAAETKREAVAELISLLAARGLVSDSEQALHDVLQREAVSSTGLQHGVAIPHATTNAVNQLVCAVGIKRTGIDFESLDGKPSQIIVLELAPRIGGTPHLGFLAAMSQVLDAARRSRLTSVRLSRDEVKRVLLDG